MASDAVLHLAASSPIPPDVAERRERARSVSADLEAIFGDATPSRRRATAAITRVWVAPGSPIAADAPRRISAASLGGLAAAALAGVAAGSLLVKPGPISPARTAAPEAAALPIETGPALQTPQALDASLATAPLKVAQRPAAPPRHVHGRRKPRPARRWVDHTWSRDHDATPVYAQAQAADRELRRAYDAAINSGVPRPEIIAARNRWVAARDRATQDPRGLVSTYRDIADDLTRASARAPVSAAASVPAAAPTPSTIRARFRARYPAWWS